jgi:hypothetical protein
MKLHMCVNDITSHAKEHHLNQSELNTFYDKLHVHTDILRINTFFRGSEFQMAEKFFF